MPPRFKQEGRQAGRQTDRYFIACAGWKQKRLFDCSLYDIRQNIEANLFIYFKTAFHNFSQLALQEVNISLHLSVSSLDSLTCRETSKSVTYDAPTWLLVELLLSDKLTVDKFCLLRGRRRPTLSARGSTVYVGVLV